MALEQVRAALASAKTLLGEAGASITEIRSDLADLIAKLAAGTPGSEEVAAAEAEANELLTQLGTAAAELKDAAAQHTPS